MMALAMTVDIGWLVLVEGQLQNAADSSSKASAAQLIDEGILSGNPSQVDDIVEARDFAETFAAHNTAARVSLLLDRNDLNETDGGIVVGYIQDPLDLNDPLQTDSVSEYNSVQVTASLSQEINGPLAMFLGAFSGMDNIDVSAQATATVDDRIIGFEIIDDENLQMLPFAIYEDAWEEAFDGAQHDPGSTCPHEPDVDNYSYNESTGLVVTGSDGIPEISVYPNSTTVCTQPGAPGNFGTVDIGPDNNSTSALIDQILYGVTQADLDIIGGMTLADDDEDGIYSKWLNGNTGVSTSIRSSLISIEGKPRLLPLYRTLVGTGDTATYEIVRFVGVRVVDVQLTGALTDRHLVVQPCLITSSQAVIDPDAPKSHYVYAIAITR